MKFVEQLTQRFNDRFSERLPNAPKLPGVVERLGLQRFSRAGLTLPLGLAAVVMVAALLVVSLKHENRLLTTQIEKLRVERDRLDQEWAQLQLEEAALAHHARIETLARGQLGMAEPRDYVVLQLPKKLGADPNAEATP